MAEEFDIKSIWDKSKEFEDPKSLHMNMLERKGTKTTLYWVKFILWIEFCLSLIGIPILLFVEIEGLESVKSKIIACSITILYLFYYQFLIKAINQFSYDGNVVQSLRKVYRYLRFYLLHYKVVIWASLLAGTIIAMYDPENQEALQMVNEEGKWLRFFIVISLMLGTLGGLMTFLIHLIYGRKIRRLRKTVKDLELEE